MSTNKPFIAVVKWQKEPTELIQAQGLALSNLGYKYQYFGLDDVIPQKSNIIFLQVPYKPVPPLIKQLMNIPIDKRPVFVYWYQQSINYSRYQSLQLFLSKSFSDLHRFSKEADFLGNFIYTQPISRLKEVGRRLGYMGDIIWLHKHKALDVFVLSSYFYEKFFLDLGSILL